MGLFIFSLNIDAPIVIQAAARQTVWLTIVSSNMKMCAIPFIAVSGQIGCLQYCGPIPPGSTSNNAAVPTINELKSTLMPHSISSVASVLANEVQVRSFRLVLQA